MFTKSDLSRELKNSEVILVCRRRPSKERELQTHKLISARAKGFRKNNLQTNYYLYGKQTI